MKRICAALSALAVVAGAILVTTGVAEASPRLSASQMDCNSAAAASATAQVKFSNALNVVVARAKELGFTADQIGTASAILASGSITADQKSQLMMIYSEHASILNVTSDLSKINTVVNTRLALGAAQAAQNIACTGFVPMVGTPPAATNVTPGAVVLNPMVVMPKGAPKAGDGSLAGR